MANKTYQIASIILQVPVLAIALIIILVWLDILSFQEWLWLLVTLLHLSLLPLLYGAFVYKTKRISDSEIMARQERVLPFFIITFVYGFFLLETMLFNAPGIFTTLAVYFFMLALLLSVVTIFWKVSVHTAGVTQFVLLLTILVGSHALLLSPLILFTGWLRIKMRSHNFWQVLGGIVLALVSTFVAVNIRLI